MNGSRQEEVRRWRAKRGPRWRHSLFIRARSTPRIGRRNLSLSLCSVAWSRTLAPIFTLFARLESVWFFLSLRSSHRPVTSSLSLSLYFSLLFSSWARRPQPSHQHCSQVPLLAQPDGFHLGSRMEETWTAERFLFSAIPWRVRPISSGPASGLCRFIVLWPIRDNCSGHWLGPRGSRAFSPRDSSRRSMSVRAVLADAACFITCKIIPSPCFVHDLQLMRALSLCQIRRSFLVFRRWFPTKRYSFTVATHLLKELSLLRCTVLFNSRVFAISISVQAVVVS